MDANVEEVGEARGERTFRVRLLHVEHGCPSRRQRGGAPPLREQFRGTHVIIGGGYGGTIPIRTPQRAADGP